MKHSFTELVQWLIKDVEMRKRLIFTVAVVALLRLAFMIPIPGIDLSRVEMFMRGIGDKPSPIFQYNVLKSARISIFSLGMMTFVSSCLLLQLASVVMPLLRGYLMGDEKGRAKIVQYTYALTLALSVIQSFIISLWLQNPNRFGGISIVSNPGMVFQITCVLTMTSAVVLIIFLAEMINRRGIGNGYAWVIISPLFIDFIVYCQRFSTALMSSEPANRISSPGTAPLIILLTAMLIYGAYYFYNKKTTVKINRNNAEVGTLNFRPTMVGREAISYTKIAFIIPFCSTLFDKSYISYLVYVIAAIFWLTFLYSRVVFDSNRMAGQIRQFGFSIEGTDLLKQRMNENLKIAALFLIAAFVLPDLLEEYVGVNEIGGKSSIAFGLIPHFSIIVFIGVLLDTLSQVNFFKSKQESSEKDWGVCYTAFTEPEAEIKTMYLKTHGIKSLIEPFRFSWGMPIRTMIDQYRIYTPSDKISEARNLILKVDNPTI